MNKEDYNWIIEKIRNVADPTRTKELTGFVKFMIWLNLWSGNSKERLFKIFLDHYKRNGKPN